MSRRNNDDLYEGKTIGELLVEGFEEFADVLKADKKAVPGKVPQSNRRIGHSEERGEQEERKTRDLIHC